VLPVSTLQNPELFKLVVLRSFALKCGLFRPFLDLWLVVEIILLLLSVSAAQLSLEMPK
jgi:hypothetical protein